MPAMNFLLPEIILSLSAFVYLMLGAFQKKKCCACLYVLSSISLVAVIYFSYYQLASLEGKNIILFKGMFIFDQLAVYAKTLIGISSIAVLFIYLKSNSCKMKSVFEIPVLITLSTVGMYVLVSASSIISMYLGIELMSFALYILVALNRDDERSSEAGIKYFVLGALSSCLILYGSTFIYGFAGSLNFAEVTVYMQNLVANQQPMPSAMLIGSVFIIAGLLFKLSLVPFHMWAPDVYEGAEKPVVAFLSTAPKVAAFIFFARLINFDFAPAFNGLQQIIIFVAAASMILGAFAALKQNNIKRLLAYSGIANLGYVIIGIAVNNQKGIEASLVYLTIYVIINLGIFAIISKFNHDESGEDIEYDKISDLAGLSKSNPYIAFSLAVLMFSVAGIPPLAGFFGKFFIFTSALNSGLYVLSIIGVVTSVVAAFYYLRIIKVMYFDELPENPYQTIVNKKCSYGLNVIILVSVLINLFFLFKTELLTKIVTKAAASLF